MVCRPPSGTRRIDSPAADPTRVCQPGTLALARGPQTRPSYPHASCSLVPDPALSAARSPGWRRAALRHHILPHSMGQGLFGARGDL
jgi:hypothetical protein